MARYNNLKDYLQNEHIKLINGAITEYQHDGSIRNEDIKILSLYCTDDEFNNLKMELGVSVNITSESEIKCNTISFYKITLVANLDLRFHDIRVMDVEKSNKNEFPEDNILNHFILPDVRKNDLERIGGELYSYYQYYAEFNGIDFPLDKIINNMNAPIFFTELPDDCLGRVNFYYSDIEIFHYNTSLHELKYDGCHAEPGTILINKKRYYDERDGEFLITVAHELVHWQLHQKFLKLLVILGTDSDTMNCKQEPILYDESMPDIQKAFCIAEWQANALAMRLAIPRSTVDTAINMVSNDLATHYDNSGDRMQACVINFARLYGVSCYVAKERLRQLGYDFVDGTILEYENNSKRIQPAPFYFQPGTLKENETFVIYRANYEKLISEDKEFAELINSRMYIYLGYVVCLFDAKYIIPIRDNGKIVFILSEYAREHAGECCLKFAHYNEIPVNRFYKLYGNEYLNKLEDNEYVKYESPKGDISLTEEAKKDKKAFFDRKEERKKAKKILAYMEINGIDNFQDALKYHKKRRQLSYLEIARRTGLSKDTVESYFAKPGTKKYREPSLESIMMLCNALELEELVAEDLIKKAEKNLNEDNEKGAMYKYLLTITNASLAAWNVYLSEAGLPTLPNYKGKS